MIFIETQPVITVTSFFIRKLSVNIVTKIWDLAQKSIFRCPNHERGTIPDPDQNLGPILGIVAVTEMISIKKLIHMKKMVKEENLTQLIALIIGNL